MFLREALCRDAEIEEAIADLYADLADRHAFNSDLALRWRDLARRERRRARVLHAIVAVQAIAEDDGPFLVHVPLQLARLRRAVEDARRDAIDAIEPIPAVELAERIEAAERGTIYQSLLELGRPEVVRLLRLLDSQSLPSCNDRVSLAKLHDAAQALATVAS